VRLGVLLDPLLGPGNGLHYRRPSRNVGP
jgi:hypothetical protein